MLNDSKTIQLLIVSWIVYILGSCLSIVHAADPKPNAEPTQEHDTNPQGDTRAINPREKELIPNSEKGGCRVNPNEVADFAKGVAFQYPAMVQFLSAPACLQISRTLSQAILASGSIKFNDKGPLRLDRYADQLKPDELQSATNVDALVLRTFPGLLRQNPVSTRDLLPLVAQVSLLSPSAGREAWVTAIQQELFAGDDMLKTATSTSQRNMAATSLAQKLGKMGLEEPLITQVMAKRVLDMALMVQVDSLNKMFRSLGAATKIDPNLIKVYNSSASALSSGVSRGNRVFSRLDRKALMKSVFVAVRSSLGISEELDEAGQDLDDAVAILSQGSSSFKYMMIAWSHALDILQSTATQETLARTVAYSLTPSVIFLSSKQVKRLISAAENYPLIAFSLQLNYQDGLYSFDEDRRNGELSNVAWKQLKRNYLTPMASELLTLSSDKIDPLWLREVTAKKILQPEDVEKKFPRMVLAYLNEREYSIREAAKTSDGEAAVASMAQNLAILWTLTNVHYPALSNWATEYENKE